MVVYTKNLYTNKIRWKDIFSLSGNIAFLSIAYTFVGGLVSFVFYYLFDEYGPTDHPPRGMEWEKKSVAYKLYDICVEIALIGLISFWLTFTINTRAPIIPVPVHLASFVDSYTTGMFFTFTIFLFMNDLSNKLMYVYKKYLGKHFEWMFPNEGSILDLSLRYGPRKTDKTNSN